LAAQVTAALIEQLMWQLVFFSYIRRFKNRAGDTLREVEPPAIQIDFNITLDMLAATFKLLSEDRDEDACTIENTSHS
jgi:hypothetical protein